MSDSQQLTSPGRLRDAITARLDSMLRMLAELVRIDSPSDSKADVDRAVAWVEAAAAGVGGTPARYSQTGYGDLLEIRFGADSGSRPVMLLGHLDTVWPVGTLVRMPFRVESGRAYGPGVLDMKAGVVMALTAMAALREAACHGPVTLLLNSDEEVGSDVSRQITERLARESCAVFVLEPAQGDAGAYKTARKGVGNFRLEVEGVAAHSGVDFSAGHSAVLELARQIEAISRLTDLNSGTTLNPGVVGGGTRSNVIAAEAWAEIDLRVRTKDEATRMEKILHGLRPVDPACKLRVTGGLNRPPMERTPGTIALFQRAFGLAEELGFTLEEAETGGGSDGNFTSALGVPTLDGMGAVGNGAHAEHESILVSSLVPRTALLAAMIAQTIRADADPT